LPSLRVDLANNNLTSRIPSELYSLSKLKYLFLAKNNFLAGKIPAKIGTLLPNLVDLSYRGTHRTGTLPTSIGNLKKLVLLDLFDNNLKGTIPTEIGQMGKLRFLFLNKNKFTGTLPKTFSKLSLLETVLLHDNDFHGGLGVGCNGTTRPRLIDLVSADCSADATGLAEVICPCCTCCTDAVPCGVDDYYGDQDPVWDYNYTRTTYLFNGGANTYPVPDLPAFQPGFGIPGITNGTTFAGLPLGSFNFAPKTSVP
jgi:hypothetical protein